MSDINKNAVSCKQFRLTIFKLSVEAGIKFTEYCLVKMTNCARLKQVVLPIIRFLLRNIILFLSRMTIPITMFLLHKGDSSFKYYIFYTNDKLPTLLSWLQNIPYINRQHFRYKLILFFCLTWIELPHFFVLSTSDIENCQQMDGWYEMPSKIIFYTINMCHQ